MNNIKLPDFLNEKYLLLRKDILKRLKEFENVSSDIYFYEACFCICTPQSKAASAMKVQNELMEKDFYKKGFDPTSILRRPENYIRFHNQKAKRLLLLREQYPTIKKILESDLSGEEKREWIYKNVNGYGRKESAHFLRNIGYKNLAILDRHILKHLVTCGVFNEIPKIGSEKQYKLVEEAFKEYADDVGISIDELDLLFWSYEAGTIIK